MRPTTNAETTTNLIENEGIREQGERANQPIRASDFRWYLDREVSQLLYHLHKDKPLCILLDRLLNNQWRFGEENLNHLFLSEFIPPITLFPLNINDKEWGFVLEWGSNNNPTLFYFDFFNGPIPTILSTLPNLIQIEVDRLDIFQDHDCGAWLLAALQDDYNDMVIRQLEETRTYQFVPKGNKERDIYIKELREAHFELLYGQWNGPFHSLMKPQISTVRSIDWLLYLLREKMYLIGNKYEIDSNLSQLENFFGFLSSVLQSDAEKLIRFEEFLALNLQFDNTSSRWFTQPAMQILCRMLDINVHLFFTSLTTTSDHDIQLDTEWKITGEKSSAVTHVNQQNIFIDLKGNRHHIHVYNHPLTLYCLISPKKINLLVPDTNKIEIFLNKLPTSQQDTASHHFNLLSILGSLTPILATAGFFFVLWEKVEEMISDVRALISSQHAEEEHHYGFIAASLSVALGIPTLFMSLLESQEFFHLYRNNEGNFFQKIYRTLTQGIAKTSHKLGWFLSTSFVGLLEANLCYRSVLAVTRQSLLALPLGAATFTMFFQTDGFALARQYEENYFVADRSFNVNQSQIKFFIINGFIGLILGGYAGLMMTEGYETIESSIPDLDFISENQVESLSFMLSASISLLGLTYSLSLINALFKQAIYKITHFKFPLHKPLTHGLSDVFKYFSAFILSFVKGSAKGILSALGMIEGYKLFMTTGIEHEHETEFHSPLWVKVSAGIFAIAHGVVELCVSYSHFVHHMHLEQHEHERNVLTQRDAVLEKQVHESNLLCRTSPRQLIRDTLLFISAWAPRILLNIALPNIMETGLLSIPLNACAIITYPVLWGTQFYRVHKIYKEDPEDIFDRKIVQRNCEIVNDQDIVKKIFLEALLIVGVSAIIEGFVRFVSSHLDLESSTEDHLGILFSSFALGIMSLVCLNYERNKYNEMLGRAKLSKEKDIHLNLERNAHESTLTSFTNSNQQHSSSERSASISNIFQDRETFVRIASIGEIGGEKEMQERPQSNSRYSNSWAFRSQSRHKELTEPLLKLSPV